MILGFTGTREGMTDQQKESLKQFLKKLQSDSLAFKIHHGDCVGADDEFVNMCAEIYRCLVHVVCHPPSNKRLRAFNTKSNETLPEKDYLARNRDIVDACQLLIATTKEMVNPGRGGTWYTIDYARKRGKKICVIFPDGTFTDYQESE